MLQNDFYVVLHEARNDNGYEARIRINAAHPILEGHFPGQPIVPGVCMVQIVKELTETILEKKLMLSEGDNIKFLSVIDPIVHGECNVTIQFQSIEQEISINASLWENDIVFFKIKGLLTEKQ